MPYQIQRAVVIGAGTMGAAIAAHLANAGLPTTLLDITPNALTSAEEKQGLTLADRVVRNRIVQQGLERALLNLLTNALKYSPADSPVVLTTREQDGELWLAVRDEGVGIPLSQQDRIFERFQRAGDGSRASGSGLGLPIVKAIAEAHGGRVELQSTPGRGATFTIVIPVDQQTGGET